MTASVELKDRLISGQGTSPVLLEWKNISVRVGGKKYWKFKKSSEPPTYILENASGAVRSGNLVAVLGASGSGKTTLLAAISKRMTADISGHVLVNGLLVSQDQLKRLSSFVPQFDIAVDSLTVHEHLSFVSKLRGIPETRMVYVINELNLGKCQHTRISNLSGGERKKVNLAGELLTDPDILFCDEPTTGLDSFSALSVVKTLRNLADIDGKAIICTIHHPASALFECFTDVVLVKRGQVLYQGPTCDATTFFDSINIPLPPNCNPADHYFKLVSEFYDGDTEDAVKFHRAVDVIETSHRNNIAKKCSEANYNRLEVVKKLNSDTKHACWPSQLYLLLHRGILDGVRSFREYVIVTLIFLITSITISSLYFHVTPSSQTAVQDIRGALFVLICELVYTVSYAVFYVFPQELPLLRREVGERIYHLSAYYTHKALLTVPKVFFESFLFVGIVYGFVRFLSGFATYVGIATVSAVAGLMAVAHSYLLTCMTGSMELSIEYANIIYLLFALLSGLYLNIRAFPITKNLSFFFFAQEGVSIYYWRTVTNITCDEGRPNATCLPNGLAVLEDYGYGSTLETVYFNYLLMSVQILIIHTLAYLCLRRFVERVGFY